MHIYLIFVSHLAVVRANSQIYAQVLLLAWAQESIWSAKDQIHVGQVQDKHPTCCISPSPQC